MVSTAPDQKRVAIGEKLASMLEIQKLIIANEQYFIQNINDPKISEYVTKMLEDDQKNIGIIETAITQYGVQADAKDTVTEMVSKVDELTKGSKLSLYEKVVQHELLKHGQVVSGLVVHKAAQVIGADVMAALTPLNAVNFENRAHQEQLKGILEVLGTRELTGKDPDQGVWARVQDAVAAVTGIFGSGATQASDKSDMNIQDVIRMDHQKVNILFTEIEKSKDPQKIKEYFSQLYTDLSVHSEAEEQVVYPAVLPFYGKDNTDELYQEQAELKVLLDETKGLHPGSPEFDAKIKKAKEMVMDHTRQEESTMFAAIRNNLSTHEQEHLATRFKEAKKELQAKL